MSSPPRGARPIKAAEKAAPARKSAAPPPPPPPPKAPEKPSPKAAAPKPAAKPAPAPAAKAPPPPAKPAPPAPKPAAPATKSAPVKVPPPEPAAPKAAAPAPKPTPKPSKAPPPPVIAPEKDIAVRDGKIVKDQIVLTCPDPFWLHAYWQLSVQSVQRAEAALGQEWHGARPVLRLLDVTSTDTTSTSEAVVRDIAIHGGCSHWYIDVPQPPRSYRTDIGYITRSGRFWPISRSNVVNSLKAGGGEALDENWANNLDDMAAKRVIAAAMGGDSGRTAKDNFGTGATPPGRLKKFFFELDAELIVHGKTDPTASVTLQNEVVKLNADGSFTMRYALPDSRQIIPAVATASDGMEEQTIVLAIERNTKRLDPMVHDLYGES